MSTNEAKDLARKLKIKLGSVKRNHKELQSYEKEELKQQEKIAKMKNDNEDPYSIKKQEEVLADTQQMLPETKGRLGTSIKDLEEHLKAIQQSASATELIATEDYIQAQALVTSLANFVQ